MTRGFRSISVLLVAALALLLALSSPAGATTTKATPAPAMTAELTMCDGASLQSAIASDSQFVWKRYRLSRHVLTSDYLNLDPANRDLALDTIAVVMSTDEVKSHVSFVPGDLEQAAVADRLASAALDPVGGFDCGEAYTGSILFGIWGTAICGAFAVGTAGVGGAVCSLFLVAGGSSINFNSICDSRRVLLTTAGSGTVTRSS